MSDAQGLALIGLGLMGSRMASRLLRGGFRLRGFDPDLERVREFERMGGTAVSSPAEAVDGCWAALLSLPDSNVTREVCLGEGGLKEADVTSLFVYDTTTGSPADAAEMSAEMAGSGIIYSDATLSGNSTMAEQGDLVVMVGGTQEAYRRGTEVFECIGRSHHHVGPAGSGSRMKLLVNHVLTVHRMALAEGLVVAEKAGLDLDTTLEVLKDSLAYSRAMDTWGERMVAGDHARPASRLRQGHKDARLIVEHGTDLGAPVDLVGVVRAALAEGEAGGLGDLDNSAVMEVLRRRAGIGRANG